MGLMSFFARLAQVLKSNLNELISRSEDPEKMLEQVIRDMSEQLTEATKQVAVAIADEKRLEKALNNEAGTAADWEKKAMLAVKAGKDELAKEALARKKEHDGLAAQYREQWEKQSAAVKQLKMALKALNQKIEEAKRKKNVLLARKRRAEAMKSIQETMSGLTTTSHFETFDRMAGKIEQMEAEAEASAEVAESYTGDTLKARFSELEQTAGADEDLLELKRKMGLVAPAEAPAVATRVAEPEEAEEEMSAEDLAELDEALEALKKREAGA